MCRSTEVALAKVLEVLDCHKQDRNLDVVNRFVEEIPESLRQKSGSVFYSGVSPFSSRAGLYILGINPGGGPANSPESSISKHIHDVLHHKRLDWLAYKDESWSGHAPGKHPLQKNVLHLLKVAEKNAREVPASEVVFLQSRGVGDLRRCYGKSYEELADECWPFHEAVIDKLGIRVIAVYGKDSGEYVLNRLTANERVAEFPAPRGKGIITSSVYRNGDGLTVVNLWFPGNGNPHWTTQGKDPTGLVADALKEMI